MTTALRTREDIQAHIDLIDEEIESYRGLIAQMQRERKAVAAELSEATTRRALANSYGAPANWPVAPSDGAR